MKTEMLNYELPDELIAQKPLAVRSQSRLLALDRQSGKIIDRQFCDIAGFLRSGDCLVLNDTKVIPARFFARRPTGGKLEGLFLTELSGGIWETMLKPAAKVKVGQSIILKDKTGDDFCTAELIEKKTDGKCLIKVQLNSLIVLEQIGFPPLPPYIKRTDDSSQADADKRLYQTVFAKTPGAVAAPTAGLHFTKELIEQLKNIGVNFAYVTLHVGAGTFKPVTAEDLKDHQIHSEWMSIDTENAVIINAAKQKGNRLIAVGTTSVRTLESAAENSTVQPANKSTELFIMPGYKFKIVDAMITNFHLPKSTLLALVCSFAGTENTFNAYRHAIENRYRFYSYGDAMMIF